MDIKLKTETAEFIKTHKKMSFFEFKKATNSKINECYYYGIRREIFPRGVRANAKNKSSVNITITTVPSAGLSKETKDILSRVIKAINVSKGTRMEIIENILDKTLEIRQVGIK